MADESSAQPPSRRKRSSPYPRDGLREAEDVMRTVFRMGPRHVRQDALAQELGYSSVTNGAYRRVRASANYFGLVDFTGDEWVSVPDDWIQILHDEDADKLAEGRARAVRNPTLYQQLFAEYEGRMLPRGERLARELHLQPQYGILKDAAESAAEVFMESVRYAGLLDERGFLGGEPVRADESEPEVQNKPSTEDPASRPTAALAPENGMDRIEIRLRDGRKVHVLIPSPGTLTAEDKARIKGHIDLVIEGEVE